VVVTKGGLSWDAVGGPSKRDSSRQAILQGMEDSLRRLGTDYVDLFLIHWPDVATPLEETMGALNHLVETGKTRFVGVSNFSPDQLRHCRPLAPICASQVGYNLFDRRWESRLFPTAVELGIGIMAYGSMAHGLLTGTFTPDTKFADGDWRSKGIIFGQSLFTPENFPKNVAVADQLRVVTARLDTNLPSLAIAWVLRHPAVSVALTGIRTRPEIEANVNALDVNLSPSDLREIDEIMTGAAGQVEAIPT
jgi:aryl-alcohol dehydrogenase-like predicted oxidoreductase